jgi:peptidoglycan-N-acetylglucosamine deacetylase
MTRPLASLSLDADNLWAYQMTHGDPGWEALPTYLDDLAAVVLPALAERGLTITFFVVGQDAARPENRSALAAVAQAGHEVGNHSFRHEPWLHRYSVEELHREMARTEEAIGAVTGALPVGFRGPGYSLSPDVIRVLIDRGYRYDCSTLPTVIGPLARRYYFRSAKLTDEQRAERSYLFGSARDGMRSLRPYLWEMGDQQLLEIPVTTLPLVRVPVHLSYVLYLAGISAGLAFQYFANAMRLCRLRGIEPSLLLHPLDFLGADDVDSLRFFPGMQMTGATKRTTVLRCLDELARHFEVVTVEQHAAAILRRGELPLVSAVSSAPRIRDSAPSRVGR